MKYQENQVTSRGEFCVSVCTNYSSQEFSDSSDAISPLRKHCSGYIPLFLVDIRAIMPRLRKLLHVSA